jgi:hypothetical protein
MYGKTRSGAIDGGLTSHKIKADPIRDEENYKKVTKIQNMYSRPVGIRVNPHMPAKSPIMEAMKTEFLS